MKSKEEVRNKWLHIRLNDSEYKKVEAFWKSSTCNELSNYARTTLQKKPVVIKYRDASADEILSEMIRLKNELNAIGNNFNQVVHKLHTLDHVPQIKIWVIQNESIRQNFMNKVEEIKVRMNEIYEVWSQK
jgi:hypothetical protein